MIITLDGKAGTGKSTISKQIAEKLNFVYFDTGAMYRSITWFFLKNQVDLSNEKQIEEYLEKFSYQIIDKDKKKGYLVDSQDITEEIRKEQVTANVSYVAAIAQVRAKLVELQRSFASHKNVVFEGRDMGTVVFPDADLKIFLTAKADIRAKRRHLELCKKFPESSFDFNDILKKIEKRDHLDSTREISPLKQAQDAIAIDTSDLSIEQVIEKILDLKQSVEKKKHSRVYSKKRFFYGFILFLAKVFFKIFYRHKVYGKDHYIPGAAIIAANHISFFDPPVVAISCPDEIHFLARESLFRIPFLGWLIKKLNSHPVSETTSDAIILKQILKLLSKGKKILFFPEGTRSKTEEIGKLESGVSFLFLKSKTAIIPTYVHGTYSIWERGKKFPRLFGKTVCVFGSPIYAKEFEDLPKKQAIIKATKRLEGSLKNLKAWCDSGKKGSPP